MTREHGRVTDRDRPVHTHVHDHAPVTACTKPQKHRSRAGHAPCIPPLRGCVT